MGNHDHVLNDYQFRSAKDEGKEASDWLSTQEGHNWQSFNFRHPAGSSVNAQNYGLFSMKDYYGEERGPSEEYRSNTPADEHYWQNIHPRSGPHP